MPSPRLLEQLTTFLAHAFEDHELRSLARVVGPSGIEADIIGATASIRQVADSIIGLLVRYHLIDDEFFNILESQRVNRRAEIQKFREAWVDGAADYHSSTAVDPSFDFPGADVLFGHSDTLAKIVDHISTSRSLQVLGIPGVGKSTLVTKAVHKLKRTARSLWIHCKEHRTLEQILVYIASFAARLPGSTLSQELLRRISADPKRHIQLMLAELDRAPCVIVLDGAENVAPELEPLASAALCALQRSCLVFTSIQPVPFTIAVSTSIPSVRVHSLELRDAAAMLTYWTNKVSSKSLSDEQVALLALRTHGHPLQIKLTATLLDVLPIEELIADLSQFSEEVSDYVVSRAIDVLSCEQRNLLEFLACIAVPFPLRACTFHDGTAKNAQLFKDLVQKCLVEKSFDDLYIVHSLIAEAILDRLSDEVRKKHGQSVIAFYKATPDLRIGESLDAIRWMLECDLVAEARRFIERLLAALMGAGSHSLAFVLITEWTRVPSLEAWWYLYYNQGRLLRAIGKHKAALESYAAALARTQDSDDREGCRFEYASCALEQPGCGEDARAEALAVYRALSESNDRVIKAMSILALTSANAAGDQAKILALLRDQLDELAPFSSDPSCRGAFLKTKAELGERLLEIPDERRTGFKLIREATSEMARGSDRGQYVLPLRHFWIRLVRQYEADEDFQSALECRLSLAGMHHDIEDLERFVHDLFEIGRLSCLLHHYRRATHELIHALDLISAMGPANASLLSKTLAWLCVALWNTGKYADASTLHSLHLQFAQLYNLSPYPLVFIQVLDEGVWDPGERDPDVREFLLRLPDGMTTETVRELKQATWDVLDQNQDNVGQAIDTLLDRVAKELEQDPATPD